MERLQKALQKARLERHKAEPHIRKEPPTWKGSSTAVEQNENMPVTAAWEALESFSPDADHLMHHRVTTLHVQPAMNPFDMLCTKIFLLMRQNGWTRLAITSPTKECGKTTIACNLAAGFSRQKGLRTMLFDTDLRKPSIAKTLGCSPQYEIDELLTGAVAPQDQMLRLRDNVALSMTNRPLTDPTQLLLTDRTISILQEIEDVFQPDLMIFDLPPMLVTDDARAFLRNVDCALIVARAEQTKFSHLDICEREVSEQTNVLGIVLNDCRLTSKNKADTYEEY